MHVIDAMDLEQIGRALLDDFRPRGEPRPSRYESRGSPERAGADLLVRGLDRAGFQIVKEDPCV